MSNMHLLSHSPIRNRIFLIIGVAFLALAAPFIASAHETREVATEYSFVVGFIDESAIQNDTNGIWVEVTKGETPVLGLSDTLQAQVIFGDQSRDMTLAPAFGEEGVYEAVFIPTEPGDYTFRFFGQIEGTDIDETFTSSPEGFDPVLARSELEFPASDDTGSTDDDTASVAMPLAAGAVVLMAGIGYAIRRRSA